MSHKLYTSKIDSILASGSRSALCQMIEALVMTQQLQMEMAQSDQQGASDVMIVRDRQFTRSQLLHLARQIITSNWQSCIV